MKFFYSVVLLMSLCLVVNAQTPILTANKKLVSDGAYSEMIAKDFGFLILGENSPQQGVGITLDDTKSTLKLNGLLWQGNKDIITIEGDFSVSDGIYFFDTKNGSKKSKIGLNWFRRLKGSSSFQSQSSLNKEFVLLKVNELISISSKKNNELKNILRKASITMDKDLMQKIDEKLKKIKKMYNIVGGETKHTIDLSKYKKNPTNSIELNYTKKSKTNKKGEKVIRQIPKSEYNIVSVLEDYLKNANYILTKLEKEVRTFEFTNTKENWGGHHLQFLGAKGYYQRETFRKFEYDPMRTFDKMFDDIRGNVYGIELSYNYNYSRGPKGKTIWPKNFFTRVTVSANRTSNLSSFKNSKLSLTNPLGNDINGNPINFTSDDVAFIGDNNYENGVSTAFDFDVYYFPIKLPIGVFGEIRYEYINFSSGKAAVDKELSPLRLGLLYNLINKEKDKPLFTVRVFMDRTDLSLAPNGKDNDLRFGLGVGLPINLK